MKTRISEPLAFAPVVRGVNRLEVKNSGDVSEITLIGRVGKSWWDDSGISEKEFRDALNSIPKGRPVTVHVNSEGGSVKEGLGIYNAIKERSSEITCRIGGYALSIASVFPLAASKVISPKSAIWMMHKAWNYTEGNSDDMEAAALMLKEHDKMLAEIYSEATGKTLEEIEAAMTAETWVRGSQAVEFGLADESDEELTEEDDNKKEEDAEASYRPLHPDFINRCKNLSPSILNAISAPKQGAGKKQNNEKKENTVNKKDKIALLKSWGVEASETMADAEIDALVEAGKPKSKQPENKKPDNKTNEPQDAIAKIQAQLERSERRRIEDRVRAYVVDQKITMAEVPIYVSAMLNDEEGTAKILDEKESALPGGEPTGYGVLDVGLIGGAREIQGKATPFIENIYKEKETPEARYAALKANWGVVMADAIRRDKPYVDRGGVQASNTFSGSITTNMLIMGCITKLGPKLAALSSFCRDSKQDPYKPLAVGIQKFNVSAQDGSTAETSVTNWEAAGGDSTIDALTITPLQYTERMHLSNAELNSGFRMDDLVNAKIRDFGAKILQVAMAPITTANFTTNAPLTRASGAFNWSDMQTLWGQLKKSNLHNAMLDGEYLARIINVPTQFQKSGVGPGKAWSEFGWDNINLQTDWTGAGANVRGFACGDQAVGLISGMPLTPPEGIPGNTAMIGVASIPDAQVAIQTWVWFSLATRTMWASYEIIFGSTLVDETDGVIIKSA